MQDGELVASINISGPTQRFDDAARTSALPALREAATKVTRNLG